MCYLRRRTCWLAIMMAAVTSCTTSELPQSPFEEPHRDRPRLVFVRSIERDQALEAEIWGLYPDGDLKRLTDSHMYLSEPTWSPDGGSIIASCGPGDTLDADLCRFNLVSGRMQKLTERMGAEGPASFSPDGKWLLLSWLKRSGSDLYKIRLENMEWERLTSTPTDEHSPEWSPDGRWIIFLRDGRVVRARADGSHTRPLTPRRDRCDSPSWSPDSRWIAYTKVVSGVSQLFKLDVTSMAGDEIQLTNSNLSIKAPAWSPAGNLIAFSIGGNSDIATISSSGGPVHRLTEGEGEDHSPSWTPEN